MSNKFDYSIEELFEELKNDATWEPNAEMRVKIADGLKGKLLGFM